MCLPLSAELQETQICWGWEWISKIKGIVPIFVLRQKFSDKKYIRTAIIDGNQTICQNVSPEEYKEGIYTLRKGLSITAFKKKCSRDSLRKTGWKLTPDSLF